MTLLLKNTLTAGHLSILPPWDFFHTMENVAGEDLGWFWRSWVLNSWKLDQSVKDVTYVKSIPANGAEIILENLEKMPMPVTVLIKEANGKEHTINLVFTNIYKKLG